MNVVHQMAWDRTLGAYLAAPQPENTGSRNQGRAPHLFALPASALCLAVAMALSPVNARAEDRRLDDLAALVGKYVDANGVAQAAPVAATANVSPRTAAPMAHGQDARTAAAAPTPPPLALPGPGAAAGLAKTAHEHTTAKVRHMVRHTVAAPVHAAAAVANAKVVPLVPRSARLGIEVDAGQGGMYGAQAEAALNAGGFVFARLGADVAAGRGGAGAGLSAKVGPVDAGVALDIDLERHVERAVAALDEELGTGAVTSLRRSPALVKKTGRTVVGILRPRQGRNNAVRTSVQRVVGKVLDTTGDTVAAVAAHSGLDTAVTHVTDKAGHLLEGAGKKTDGVLSGLTGSHALGDTVSKTTGELASGVRGIVGEVLAGDLQGALGATTGTVTAVTGQLVGGATGTVSGLLGSGSGLDGVGQQVSGVVGGIGNAVDHLVGDLTGQPAMPAPAAVPPGPSGADHVGLIIGTGGLTGSLGQLLDSAGVDALFGGDGYIRNGNLKVNAANVQQGYSVMDVAGLPVVQLTPVGRVLDGAGNAATGGNASLTLIGGVTSDSYITNINNGDPGGVLGLVLPDKAPAWASRCASLTGVVNVDCWAVNAAQDYQVLVGDGAYANGSKEVVIGTGASHRLPEQTAAEAFPGDGVNDPDNPTGVPTGDYAARLGHSVVIGDSAAGTANAQTLLGAGATSDKADSVALGHLSNASRGGQSGYTAFGLDAPQTSVGEVAVGASGRERQITHVAAGSSPTDAVNVAQLQGAITLANGVDLRSVKYDVDAAGSPDYRRITLGGGVDGTVLANVAGGAIAANSRAAVNGGQLHDGYLALAAFFGGDAAYGSGGWVAPSFRVSRITSNGIVTLATYANMAGAFEAMDGSLVQLNRRISSLVPEAKVPPLGTDNDYLAVNSAAGGATATGDQGVAVGPVASASGQGSVAVGDGALASADGSVALGAGSVADRAGSVSVGSEGAERQVVHVADGTAATDAVNVRQLRASEQGTLRYDTAADGSTDYASVTLGAPGAQSAAPVQVRNVAAGTAGTDAVNLDQLNKGMSDVMDWSRAYTDERFTSFQSDLRRIDDRAAAGVASAMAMAGLPQPYEAGRSMASFAASTFHGESGMAVGISGVTEGGRWIYKLSGSANTRGDSGLTVGAGIQW